MWDPKSVEELESMIQRGDLEETRSLDFKRELGSSKEVAKDIAAMTTDGGTLVYGVDEDEHDRPTLLAPIPLTNAAERITNIAQTSIHEPPEIQIRTLIKDEDVNTGYLVVLVPKSARAPHMVQVKGDNRFYGRGDKGNRILGEGEVARLYRQREAWERDVAQLLDEVVQQAPFAPDEGPGHIHLAAFPLGSSPNLLKHSVASASTGQPEEAIRGAALEAYSGRWDPPLGSTITTRHADYWEMNFSQPPSQEREAEAAWDTRLFLDGRVSQFFGGAVEPREFGLLIFDPYVAGVGVRFVHLVGRLLSDFGFSGSVDIGLRLTGIRGAISSTALDSQPLFRRPRPFASSDYSRTWRATVQKLVTRPETVASQLLSDLFAATSDGAYAPFEAG